MWLRLRGADELAMWQRANDFDPCVDYIRQANGVLPLSSGQIL